MSGAPSYRQVDYLEDAARGRLWPPAHHRPRSPAGLDGRRPARGCRTCLQRRGPTSHGRHLLHDVAWERSHRCQRSHMHLVGAQPRQRAWLCCGRGASYLERKATSFLSPSTDVHSAAGDGPCRMRTRLRMCGGTRPLSFTCEPRPPPSSPGAACLSTRRWPRPLLRVRLIAMGLGLGIGMGFKRRTMPAEELEESMTGTLGPVTYLACYQCSRHPCSNVASTDAV